ncbi:MAG: twin-arginine translocase TatA/TatE family subunit [Anaerolineales bacterium]
MANLGPIELIIILVVVLLVFGVGRLSKIGGEMGSAIREFRSGLEGDGVSKEEEKAEEESEQQSTS